jgi:putative restriction endonuclease
MRNSNWNRDELIVAFNLYCKVPFSKIGLNNRHIKELSGILGRSVSAVALKLANFARLDPALQNRNISGMRHGSKAEVEIWNEFNGNWEELTYQSELLLAKFQGIPVERSAKIDLDNLPKEGKERETIVQARVNQNFFRLAILASYDNRCCITGIHIPELLVASHIIPWSVNKENRLNPCNGLCMNLLHDKAFDRGLMTITQNYEIKLSGKLIKSIKDTPSESFFLPYVNRSIMLPQRFLPGKEYLKHHNENVFMDAF